MIKKIKNLFKKKTDIVLLHVHTFNDGTKLFTYREEDLGKVSSRYYRNIMEANNYLHTFLLTKEQWTTAVNELKKRSTEALASNNNKELVQTILDINSTLDWFIEKTNTLKNANETILEMMFCMFFLLEDEVPTGYSEALNQKKIELLNENLEVRDFFLSNLKKNLPNLAPLSDYDLKLQLIVNKMTAEVLM